MAKGIYAGVETEFPIYETESVELLRLNADTVEDWFTVKNGSYFFAYSSTWSCFQSNNNGVNSSTAETTWTAKHDCEVRLDFRCYTEENYDKFTFIVAGETQYDAVSGTQITSYSSHNLKAGQTIVAKYVKDGSTHDDTDCCRVTIEVTGSRSFQTGTETKSVARKVTQPYQGVNNVARKDIYGYVGINGVARQFLRSVKPLEECTWDEISEIAASGKAPNYWSVGDTKGIKVKGTLGSSSSFPTVNGTYYVYIIGFNHDGATNTIDFGTFKTASGTSVCLVGTTYTGTVSSGVISFNMNYGDDDNYGEQNYGGWKACDIRYGLLGSTNVAPDSWFSKKYSGDVGYDATSTCATSPKITVSLMNCLPSDLRAVMKPMTIYTNNVGGGITSSFSITSSVDYLPLLSEFEVFGTRSVATSYEQNYQSQYEYYALGNSKLKYAHSANTTAVAYWLRSPTTSSGSFCCVSNGGGAGSASARYWRGVAPIFRV